MSVRVFAPAKINLTLEVGPARTDGRHPLQSVVMFADVGDWIEAEPDTDQSVLFYIRGPFSRELHDDPSNLVLDAIGALAKIGEQTQGGRVTLVKNLPIASGIGGGSADAAATLKALNALWRLGRSEAELEDIAIELGADVPVCVRSRTAWMTGAGEISEPFEALTLDAVLVNPLRPLSTRDVYREFDRMGLGADFAPRAPTPWTTQADAIAAIARIGNQLEAPACALMPEIVPMLAMLRSDPRTLAASLSGSGATVFAITQGAEHAKALAADIEKRQPGWWVRATRLG